MQIANSNGIHGRFVERMLVRNLGQKSKKTGNLVHADQPQLLREHEASQ
jgi:hypothetical protein